MRGLLHIRVPLVTRRLITLIPALVILTIGFDPTLALVLSQVVLSFGIPFALVPLVRLTSLKTLLGESANRWWTTALASVAAILLIALNATLLVLVVRGH
jgi:manganese transport protein